MVCANIPIHRKNNKECKIALGQGREGENKGGKKEEQNEGKQP